jgi:hypothetical protein
VDGWVYHTRGVQTYCTPRLRLLGLGTPGIVVAYNISVRHGCDGSQEFLGLVGVAVAYRIRVRHSYIYTRSVHKIYTPQISLDLMSGYCTLLVVTESQCI